MSDEILNKAKLGLEAKDFVVKIENQSLYLCVGLSELELSEFEINYQADEYSLSLDES